MVFDEQIQYYCWLNEKGLQHTTSFQDPLEAVPVQVSVSPKSLLVMTEAPPNPQEFTAEP